jgi:hypothetical protein
MQQATAPMVPAAAHQGPCSRSGRCVRQAAPHALVRRPPAGRPAAGVCVSCTASASALAEEARTERELRCPCVRRRPVSEAE